MYEQGDLLPIPFPFSDPSSKNKDQFYPIPIIIGHGQMFWLLPLRLMCLNEII